MKKEGVCAVGTAAVQEQRITKRETAFLPGEEKTVKWVQEIFSNEKAGFQQKFILMLQEFGPEQWKKMEWLTDLLYPEKI